MMWWKCIKDCELVVWDGGGNMVKISSGDVLRQTYHEFDGSVGLQFEDDELFCGSKMLDECFVDGTSKDVEEYEEALLGFFTDTKKNLEVLAEEAAEIIQAKSKLIRFGLDHKHYQTGEPAMQCLEQEIGDFLAMVDIFRHQGYFDDERLKKARLCKLKKLKKWY